MSLAKNDYALDVVKDEDKNMVQDILDLLHQTNLNCKRWVINPQKNYYEIKGTIDTQNKEWEVFADDLNLIREINAVRIPIISVGCVGGIPHIKIVVIPHSERIVVHHSEIIKVQKKRKFFDI